MKYVFTNGKILNGTKDMQVQEGQVILVENERITELLPAEEVGKRNLKASGYEEIDLQGKYILPGLINMHVHLAGNGKPQKKQRDNEALVKKTMVWNPQRYVHSVASRNRDLSSWMLIRMVIT